MAELLASLVAGEHERAGRLPVFAPFDGALIAEVETVGEAGVGQALQTAYRLFRERRGWLPVHQRISILERTVQILRARAEALAVEAAREGGKPLIDSRVEVARSIDSIRLCVDFLRTDAGEVVPMGINAASAGRRAFTVPEPIGVVVAVSAFNHPLNLIAHQVESASTPSIISARRRPGPMRCAGRSRRRCSPATWSRRCRPAMPSMPRR